MNHATHIDVALVRDLVASQFPEWSDLSIEPVEPGGWDNRTFRLGSEMSVRLPSHQRYAAQVEKEQRWLRELAPQLPLAIPAPLAEGRPTERFPLPWSIYAWLPGDTADVGRVDDPDVFARDLAEFLAAFHGIDTAGAPGPGKHNFYRGGALDVWDEETRTAIDTLGSRIDGAAVTEVWETGLESAWTRAPVWVHGDLVATNLLVHEGRLSAVIDFGCSAVGDPACDLPITWLSFSGQSATLFRERLDLDDATWARGRAWAMWKRLVALANDPEDRNARRVIDVLVAEHRARA